MNTIILHEPGKFAFSNTTIDNSLQHDEALVKVHRIGICGTDYLVFAGNQPLFSYPHILGYELIAINNGKVGGKFDIEPYQNKTQDEVEGIGFTNCLESISVFGVHVEGGMRDIIKILAKYSHKSDTLSYDQLALVEPLGIDCHAVIRAKVLIILKSGWILIYGLLKQLFHLKNTLKSLNYV